jgi:DNA-binding transcriptional LysR family regulator
MELRHLRYFVTVAEMLNFTRAAETLRVAQPALSRQIQDLERDVGVRLLERGGTKTALTPAGRAFLKGAKATLAAATEAVRSARDASAEALGTLRVGYMHPHFDYLLPKAIPAFRKLYPKVNVVPIELNPSRQAEALENDELDFGLIGLSKEAEDHGLMHEPFTPPITYVAALPKGHRLTKKKLIELKDCEGEKLVTISTKTYPGAATRMLEEFRKAGVHVVVLPAAETSTSVLGQVAIGVGIAVVPYNLQRDAPSGVVFRPVNIKVLFRYVAAWKAERSSPHIAAFLKILRGLTGMK